VRWLALSCAVALLAGCGGDAAQDDPAPRVETMVQDDPLLLYGSDPEVGAVTQRLASLGVDRVRITAGWSAIAPGTDQAERPDFDATDPDAYGDGAWEAVDRAVRATVDAGLEPMLDVAFWAPRWAVERPVGGPANYRWKPSATEFGDFVAAAARRYDGSFGDLPAVRLWSTWNEPNNPTFLLPQWERRGGEWTPSSPHVYRDLHNAGYDAIKAADADNRVLIGNLSSLGDPPGIERQMAPLGFTRALACVDAGLQPLEVPECEDFEPLRADGFAHHPYSFVQAPDEPSADPDEVRMADLDRLSNLLALLAERDRMRDPVPLYLTEFGYESNPPAPRGADLDTQAAWISEATAIAHTRPDVRMHAQFLLTDVEPPELFQTGLQFADGRAKPALAAFRLAFDADEDGAAFGLLRPGSGVRELALQRQDPESGTWDEVRTLSTNADGEVRFRVSEPGAYRLAHEADRSVSVEVP
jgi:hypothetical protein